MANATLLQSMPGTAPPAAALRAEILTLHPNTEAGPALFAQALLQQLQGPAAPAFMKSQPQAATPIMEASPQPQAAGAQTPPPELLPQAVAERPFNFAAWAEKSGKPLPGQMLADPAAAAQAASLAPTPASASPYFQAEAEGLPTALAAPPAEAVPSANPPNPAAPELDAPTQLRAPTIGPDAALAPVLAAKPQPVAAIATPQNPPASVAAPLNGKGETPPSAPIKPLNTQVPLPLDAAIAPSAGALPNAAKAPAVDAPAALAPMALGASAPSAGALPNAAKAPAVDVPAALAPMALGASAPSTTDALPNAAKAQAVDAPAVLVAQAVDAPATQATPTMPAAPVAPVAPAALAPMASEVLPAPLGVKPETALDTLPGEGFEGQALAAGQQQPASAQTKPSWEANTPPAAANNANPKPVVSSPIAAPSKPQPSGKEGQALAPAANPAAPAMPESRPAPPASEPGAARTRQSDRQATAQFSEEDAEASALAAAAAWMLGLPSDMRPAPTLKTALSGDAPATSRALPAEKSLGGAKPALPHAPLADARLSGEAFSALAKNADKAPAPEAAPIDSAAADAPIPAETKATPAFTSALQAFQTPAAAPKDAPAPLDKPVGQPGWSQDLGERVTWMADKNMQSAELHLNPPHLGPLEVRIEISPDQQQTNLHFITHHAAVREALEAALPRLREMLDTQQLSLGDVSVSQHSHGDQRGAQNSGFEQPQNRPFRDFAGDASEAPASAYPEDSSALPRQSGRGLLSLYA
jgi:flagellar hook-length control protein FliK